MPSYYDNDPVLKEKKSTNLLWVGIFSICMMFAGFTSAYLVLAEDTFWVSTKMPAAFIYSTISVLAGSLTIWLGLRFAKKGNHKGALGMIGITLLLGILFGYFQFQGWGKLFDRGYALVGNISSEGRYGLNFTLNYNGAPIDYDGTVYYVEDKPLTDAQFNEMMDFARSIAETPIDARSNKYLLENFAQLTIQFRSLPLVFKDGKLFLVQSDTITEPLTYDQRMHLRMFARNLKDQRGDFIMTGTYGDDFTLLYKGEALKYENRRLFKSDGTELSKVEYALLHKSRNTASSFIYILTVLHLLHFIGGILYLILISIKGMRRNFDVNNYLGIKLSGIYWHFLGILWIYLFIFLSFIH